MKKYTKFWFVIATLSGILMMTGCKKDPVPPSLTTNPLTAITLFTAKSGGTITNDGGAEITERGICWSTVQGPTITDSSVSDGTGTGSFEIELSGLSDGTTYYVRAYAKNIAGIAYGNEQSFTTTPAGFASVTTKVPSEVFITTAKSGGDIANDGGAAITAKGICWNTSQVPTILNNKTTDGVGTGGFVSNLTGLTENTTYYVRAYATNKAGTAYGNQITIITHSVMTPLLTSADISGLTSVSAIYNGNITNDGGGPVTAKGVCWSMSQHPTLTDSKTNEGTGSGSFVSNITGLSSGNIYYVRGYATNKAGTSYGSEQSFITPVTDIEGNIYKTVKIGNQVWMAENLESTKFRDNTLIPNAIDSMAWPTLTTPGYCWYRNNISHKDTYGAIYNWFTVATGKLCPDGWHVPTQAEFQALEIQIGVPADSIDVWGWRGRGKGTNLKSTTLWTGGVTGNNLTGFNVVPAGYRAWNNSQFRALGIITYIWTATDDAINGKPTVAWYRRLDSTNIHIYNATTDKQSGKSIRCLKD